MWSLQPIEIIRSNLSHINPAICCKLHLIDIRQTTMNSAKCDVITVCCAPLEMKLLAINSF